MRPTTQYFRLSSIVLWLKYGTLLWFGHMRHHRDECHSWWTMLMAPPGPWLSCMSTLIAAVPHFFLFQGALVNSQVDSYGIVLRGRDVCNGFYHSCLSQ